MSLNIKAGDHVYFMGICGTGMASAAGLVRDAGYRVTGSDEGVYPPMSTLLEELKIPVASPYSADNIIKAKPDLIVVANALSRGNAEIEYMLEHKIPYTSFPELLGELFLKKRISIVVSGTHGKTTTTSLFSWILQQIGEDPSYLIGGIPRNFSHSFHLGKGSCFVIEGDEYDTAFFDKGSKFLHYAPKLLIMNNLEFDHADIFKNLEAIEAQFTKLVHLVEDPADILGNVDDPGMKNLLEKTGFIHKITRVSTLGHTPEAPVVVKSAGPSGDGATWQGVIQTETMGTLTLKTRLTGTYNIANIAQVVASLERLVLKGRIKKPSPEALQKALLSFEGVQRRLDLLGEVDNIKVYEDFAHHPTAIRLLIEDYRRSHPDRRIVVAFEPKNATARRNIFMREFAASLTKADEVLIGKCPVDQRIPEDERMDTQILRDRIGPHAHAFESNEALGESAISQLKSGDSLIFMSSGSFSGVQYKIVDQLKKRSYKR